MGHYHSHRSETKRQGSPSYIMDSGPPTKQLEGQSEQRAVEEDEMAEIKQRVKEQIQNTHVLIYSKTTCPFCKRVS